MKTPLNIPRCYAMVNVSFSTLWEIVRAVIAGLMLSAISALVWAQATWPTIAVPKDASTFDIGGQVTINGMPMRMQVFVSAVEPVKLARWFRQSLGNPLVESNSGNKIILGRLKNEHYLTVQLEPAGTGTRGVIAVTHLKTAYLNRNDTQTEKERWLARLPSGSRLMSQMESDDADKHSTHLVIVNDLSTDMNRDHLKSMMRGDDMVLEREASVDSKTANQLPIALANGKTLFFKGQSKEAMAVIYPNEAGNTTIVLNTITQLGRAK